MGVWIETESPLVTKRGDVSHPSWVCGLKHSIIYYKLGIFASHPSWVCGLKPKKPLDLAIITQSHPSWVCGLKHDSFFMRGG